MQRPLHGVALTRAQWKLSGDFLIVPGDLWMLTGKALPERRLNGPYVNRSHTVGQDQVQ